MSRTENDKPFRVRFADREVAEHSSVIGRYRVYDIHNGDPIGSDSGFRVSRRWLKRHRSKQQRRAEIPTYRRTCDFD